MYNKEDKILKKIIPVSVIIPCYNSSKTLERAFNSVMLQSYLPKEVILVDDHSSDNGETLSLLYILKERVVIEGMQIIIISLNENKGAGSARNRGWEKASGDYIAFLDADDIWHSKKLELQYKYMEANEKVFLVGNITRKIVGKKFLEIKIPDDFEIKQISKMKLMIKNFFPTSSVFIKRNIDLKFKENKRYSEDYLLWIQCVEKGSIALMQVCLSFRFQDGYSNKGLSSNFWKMEKGELATYWDPKSGLNFNIKILLSLYSFMKFLRRLIFPQ